MFKVDNKSQLWTYFTLFPGVFIVDIEYDTDAKIWLFFSRQADFHWLYVYGKVRWKLTCNTVIIVLGRDNSTERK